MQKASTGYSCYQGVPDSTGPALDQRHLRECSVPLDPPNLVGADNRAPCASQPALFSGSKEHANHKHCQLFAPWYTGCFDYFSYPAVSCRLGSIYVQCVPQANDPGLPTCMNPLVCSAFGRRTSGIFTRLWNLLKHCRMVKFKLASHATKRPRRRQNGIATPMKPWYCRYSLEIFQNLQVNWLLSSRKIVIA